MEEKTSALLIALLFVIQSLSGVGYLTQAFAAGTITSNIINSVTMTVYDKAGQVVTGNVYEQGSKVRLDYTWSLPDNHGYHSGDTFVFTLPQAFLLFNDISGSLLNGDEEIGMFSVSKASHQVLMTFNSYIESHSRVQGILTLNTQFDITTVTGSTTQIIKIPIQSGEQVFTLTFKPNIASTIGKSGAAQGFNPKNIDWTVDVNKSLDSVQQAVVTDPIPVGLAVPVTIAVYNLNVNLDGTVSQGTLVNAGKYTVDTAGNVLKVSFTDNPIQSAYRIQYTTPITDANAGSFVNTAKFEGSNQLASQATATVTIQRLSDLGKQASKYDQATQTIDWAIQYNYNEKSIPQPEAFLMDSFNDSQELIAGSLHVYPAVLDASGKEALGAELPASEYTVSLTPAASGKAGFKLQFKHAVTSAFKITYQTKAVHRVNDDATVTNNVYSGTGATTGPAKQDIKQAIIVKNVGSVDYTARTVAWKLTINGDSQPMSGVKVTDTFPAKGLRLIPDSLVVKANNGAVIPSTQYVVDPAIQTDQGFILTWNVPITEPVTVSYTTEFHPDWISPAGSTTNYTNQAQIDWMDEASNVRTKTVSAVFSPRSEVKQNGFKSGSYNASSKEITWTVGVNYNGKTLKNAVVEDSLESKQKLVDGSLKLYNMTIPANGNAVKGTVVDSTYYTYKIDNSNKLVVTFLQPISTPYYVVFNTSLDGELIGKNIGNTAQLLDGANPVSTKLTASVTIPQGGEYVNKNGTQAGDKIVWTMYINRGQSTVADAKIIDTPTDNQLLLPDSFHLYATTVAANGSLNKAAELVKGMDYTIAFHTDSNGKQSFELSFKKEIRSAYILEYQSLIVAKDQETVSNKVSFSGNNVSTVTQETTKDIIVGVSGGSGSGSGNVRGKLIIEKTDSADSQLHLSGATFDLYRKSVSDLVYLDTRTTDAAGTIEFINLPEGDYAVKETTAPLGYDLSTMIHYVTINYTNSIIRLPISNVKTSTPPVTPPVDPPVTPPVKPPVEPPVTPPVTPPVEPPVKPPVTPPVTPGGGSSDSDSGDSSEPVKRPESTGTQGSTGPGSGTAPEASAKPDPAPAEKPGTEPKPELPVEQEVPPIEGNIKVPLGGLPSSDNQQQENGNVTLDPDGAPVETLPVTGEASHLYMQLTGFLLIILGAALGRTRVLRNK